MPQHRKIRLMLADDHNVGREAFASFIRENQDNMRVIGEAANGQELLDLVKHEEPDIVILDLDMPVLDGLQTLLILNKEYPHVKTIILSSHYNEYYVSELMLRGARGYLSKTAFSDEVFKTINTVYTEGYCFNSGVSGHIVQTLIEDKSLQDIIGEKLLSSREIEILQLICNEKQNKEIATALEISERTVKFHKQNLLQKTNSTTIVGLVKYAIRNGISLNVP